MQGKIAVFFLQSSFSWSRIQSDSMLGSSLKAPPMTETGSVVRGGSGACSVSPSVYNEPGPAHSEAWMRLLGWQDQLKAEAFASVSSPSLLH